MLIFGNLKIVSPFCAGLAVKKGGVGIFLGKRAICETEDAHFWDFENENGGKA